MPPTDNPLKLLITSFADAFVQWLLGGRPRLVRPLNVDLPAGPRQSDLLFEVIQANGQVVLLHIELQGQGSDRPMPWRMLEYMSRLVLRELGSQAMGEQVYLKSVVLYVGQGAGANDEGVYEVLDTAGQISLGWRYAPIRLWALAGEELLAIGEPALLALLGQTRLDPPEPLLAEALSRIRQVPDEEERGQLLTAFVSLLQTEEVIKMAEQMLDASDELLMDLPYLRRVREQAHQEGKREGIAEGVNKGLQEAILETITLRFNPPALDYRRVNQDLATITDRKALQTLLTTAIQCAEMASFLATLAEIIGPE